MANVKKDTLFSLTPTNVFDNRNLNQDFPAKVSLKFPQPYPPTPKKVQKQKMSITKYLQSINLNNYFRPRLSVLLSVCTSYIY